uniref:Uncharacterized protein n=1 Tax=Anguilla anguilla TaxID=7936 RepID=A0A0E9Q348_ANGAN
MFLLSLRGTIRWAQDMGSVGSFQYETILMHLFYLP